mgnify:CR=1 FL=1
MDKQFKFTRKKTICYIVEDDAPFESFPVRICSSRRLAEHYVRVLSPKWEECFGFGLRVTEFPLYVDMEEDLEFETVCSNEVNL